MLSNDTEKNIVLPNRKWKIQDGGLKTGNTFISACRWDRNQISTAKSTFSRSSNPTEKTKRLYYQPEVVNPRWRPLNRKYLYLGLLTWYQRNSKGIVWFSMSNYPMEQRRICYNQTGSGKSKMAASKPEILLSRLVDEIETKSQRLNLHLRRHAIQRD